MSNYRPYPKYKPSGVEWLGDVPEHWITKSIKWESNVARGASPRPIDDPIYFDEEGEYAWVRIADVTSAGRYLDSTTQRLSSLGSSLSVRLQPGALFLSIAGSVGKPCVTTMKCCIHDGFVYFPSWKSSIDFLYYIFASGEPYKGLGKFGTQLNLNTDTVGGIQVALPPLPEQHQIAAFLDRECGKLDALQAKQERLIELLKEKRQALISHAVTRGLDPTAKLKPSGVEWLGEVPEHWKVARIKQKLRNRKGAIKTGPFGSHLKSSDMMEGSVKVYNQRSVIDSDFSAGEFYITEQKFEELKSFEVEPLDLLVTTRGTIGRCAILPEGADKGILHPCLIRVQPSSSLDRRYLQVLIEQSGLVLEQLKLMSNATTIEVIYSDSLKEVYIPVPPLAEQRAIVAHLDEKCGKIDQLKAKAERGIELLKERRSALISAAVTGKIDVRES
jgi:type I restriction enzyme S subunit